MIMLHETVKRIRTVRILVTSVSMMGMIMPQTAQNNVKNHHHCHYSMYEMVKRR